jgi:hypothetical protein
MPVALCTSIVGRNPVVYLLDPSTGGTLASLSLPAGNLFAGVYAYMPSTPCSSRRRSSWAK